MSVKVRQAGRRGIGLGRLLGFAVLIGFGALLWRGPAGIDRVWAFLFGEPDLGSVDFAVLTRRASPNDALACPAAQCPLARVDLVSPVFPVPRGRLRAIVAEVAADDGDVRPVDEATGDEDRYIARTRLMRFPDTVSALTVDLGDGRSTLALYSRSQIGLTDFGVNRARVERWLKRIGEIAAQPPTVSDG